MDGGGRRRGHTKVSQISRTRRTGDGNSCCEPRQWQGRPPWRVRAGDWTGAVRERRAAARAREAAGGTRCAGRGIADWSAVLQDRSGVVCSCCLAVRLAMRSPHQLSPTVKHY